MRKLLPCACAVLTLLGVSPAPALAQTTSERFGTSALGRPMRVVAQGDTAAPTNVLVVAEIHGNEAAGRAIVERLRRLQPPAGVRLWTTLTINPDGHRAGTRQNGRGVDLNRNWRWQWLGGGEPWNTYFPGPRAMSEPETVATSRLIRRLDPDLTIWYHQHMNLVVDPRGDARWYARRYARSVGLRLRDLGIYHGTATGWQNHRSTASRAFVVELPAGSLTRRAVARHARAVRSVAVARAGTLPPQNSTGRLAP